MRTVKSLISTRTVASALRQLSGTEKFVKICQSAKMVWFLIATINAAALNHLYGIEIVVCILHASEGKYGPDLIAPVLWALILMGQCASCVLMGKFGIQGD